MGKLKHYLDIVVYLLHRTYWNLMSRFGQVHGVVLMYHHITDDHKDIMASCQHKPAIFEITLKRLKSEGYYFVSVDEMMNIIEQRNSTRFAVVTFDDIMDDVYTNAYPILKAMQIPFMLFVAPGLINTKEFVTMEHLLEMAKDPLCSIGSHSVSHCNLRKVENSAEEIIESKKQLEILIGHPIKYMAYPYGWHCDVSKKNMKEAEKAGYKCAFGTIQSMISQTSSKNRFFLPRMVMIR